MAEEKKYVVVAPEVYEMSLIKVETPVNLIASTIKQTQENLYTVQNSNAMSDEENIRSHTVEINKLKRAKD